jgi:hypothetical protein
MLTSVFEVRDLVKYIMPASIIAPCVLISANYCALRMLMMIGMCLLRRCEGSIDAQHQHIIIPRVHISFDDALGAWA